MDGTLLEFTDDAIDSIAEKALERNTGARGLRQYLKVMLDVMYDIPSENNVEKCIVNRNY